MYDIAIYTGLFLISSYSIYHCTKYYFLSQGLKYMKSSLDDQFKVIELMCDENQKTKLINIYNSMHLCLKRYSENVISYEKLKAGMKQIIDEIFELMDTFYYR
jgi:hypothetical protein